VSAESISSLIAAAERGDSLSHEALFTALYTELHRLARRELVRRGAPPSLGVTTLLHEAYVDIAERGGLTELYELCARARRSGLSTVPRDWLLEAAELDLDPRSWQAAVEAALGPPELAELVRMHPEFMVHALARYADATDDRPAGSGTPPWIEARLAVPGSDRSLSLLSLPEIGRGLFFDFRARAVELAAAR